LVAFHMEQQTKSAALDKANQQIIRYRQWLHRQQARLTRDGRIDWSKSQRIVVYDRTIREQNMTLVKVQGGRLFTHGGRPLDTTRMVTMFSGPGNAIFIMRPDGQFHIGSHSVGFRHHSSLINGEATACAGEISVKNGTITRLSNKSGHYVPDPIHLLQAIVSLVRQGYTAQYTVGLLGAGFSVKDYTNHRDFCIAQKFTDDKVASVDVLAAYDSYLTLNGMPSELSLAVKGAYDSTAPLDAPDSADSPPPLLRKASPEGISPYATGAKTTSGSAYALGGSLPSSTGSSSSSSSSYAAGGGSGKSIYAAEALKGPPGLDRYKSFSTVPALVPEPASALPMAIALPLPGDKPARVLNEMGVPVGPYTAKSSYAPDDD
jgi:hypothetical protein